MGYKLGQEFMRALPQTDFSSRTSGMLGQFIKVLDRAHTKDDFDNVLAGAHLLKGLLKKEGVTNTDFDRIVRALEKKL